MIAKEGKNAFYRWKIADAIVAEMEVNGGLINSEDLATYQPKIRSTIEGNYRGYEIHL